MEGRRERVAIVAFVAALVASLQSSRDMVLTIDLDLSLTLLAAAFLSGYLLASRFANQSRGSSSYRRDESGVERTSKAGENDEKPAKATSDTGNEIEARTPLLRFPPEAELGTLINRWSDPIASEFMIRGPNYLQDRVKIRSDGFLLPIRGMDLFLTDDAPRNVATNPAIMGGKLRDVPTFVVNYRMPWGVLVSCHAIPDRLLPFLKARYENDNGDASIPNLDDMSPGDRCAARFFLSSDEYRNDRIKIVPRCVIGPWVVKSAVGGKPSLIGKKLPIEYIYQKAEGEKSCYLEMDVGVCGSTSARGVLSIVRNYIQILTLDLGFVIQGNQDDELPEQMLLGTTLHRIEPSIAPQLPVSEYE